MSYDITTSDAVDWATQYPDAARNVTKICELTQQADDLEQRIEDVKKAAE